MNTILLEVKVSDIMSRYIITVTPDQSMEEVAEIFRQNKIHHLPVVENDRLIGIVSKSDFYRVSHALVLFNEDAQNLFNPVYLSSVKVGDVMTRQVATLKARHTIQYALGYFKENLFHALPVVDENKRLLGLVTTFDLLNYAFADRE